MANGSHAFMPKGNPFNLLTWCKLASKSLGNGVVRSFSISWNRSDSVLNGVINSYKIIPNEYMSTLWSYLDVSISGALYHSVPTPSECETDWHLLWCFLLSCSVITPKSATFIRPSRPKNIFSGWKTKWINSFWRIILIFYYFVSNLPSNHDEWDLSDECSSLLRQSVRKSVKFYFSDCPYCFSGANRLNYPYHTIPSECRSISVDFRVNDPEFPEILLARTRSMAVPLELNFLGQYLPSIFCHSSLATFAADNLSTNPNT